MKIRSIWLALVLALSFPLAACDFDGGVEQGRCVAYNPESNVCTLVVDTTLDQLNPHYSGKVDTFQLPSDPRDMGPAPAAGGRLMLEIDKGKLLYFDKATNSVKEMDVKYLDVEKNIGARHPKLKGKTFPIIDKDKHTVTVYSRRLESLVTFQVPPEDIDLPRYTWESGDEVRIAFRKENRQKAIRFMNVSKTNIFSR